MAGVFEAIVDAMRLHKRVAEVQSECCLALHCLAKGGACVTCHSLCTLVAVWKGGGAPPGSLVDRRHRVGGIGASCSLTPALLHVSLARWHGTDVTNARAIGGTTGVFKMVVQGMRRHKYGYAANVERSACMALGCLAGGTGFAWCASESGARVS